MGNEIRLGKVSAVDHPAGMVRVVYHEKDDDVTRMIPILSTVFSGVYSMPEVGDQVLVLHLSNGTEAGVVLGRPGAKRPNRRRGRKSCTAWTWTAPQVWPWSAMTARPRT